MKKVAFYVMNSKGFYVLDEFVKKFGSEAIEYVVSEKDDAVKDDAYNKIMKLTSSYNIKAFNRKELDLNKETVFDGIKFAIGWRWLIENERNLIVFHDSKLPKYRGFAPLVNSLINKESELSVTALYASEKYDCGDIIDQLTVSVKYPITIYDAIKKIEPLYFKLIENLFIAYSSNQALSRVPQDEFQASYSLWLDKDDYYIDWEWPAEKIKLFVDAVGFPFDGAKCLLNKEIVIFEDVDIYHDVIVEHRERHIGKIIFFECGAPVIVCKKGLLKLNRVLDANKEPMKLKFRSRFY
ncbi:methionyl-tRNA formyltransferase [Aeromonas sp. 2HA2]|nr:MULTISPECIES: formyltransferase family protein [Aeromonas]MDF2389902.1 methionyl-tRNA formyltransferase [Aeromonas sp. 2MA4]MDF2407996.1 methionyl-tRNA formyltransferase [Aeromonas sp. 2HA2]MDM5061850.1 formyltransferase family protein [Aeromonas salmonicida]WCH28649.1 formyltransferase family protein [Aeromonas salmonicida]